jgi:hypothetical protein
MPHFYTPKHCIPVSMKAAVALLKMEKVTQRCITFSYSAIVWEALLYHCHFPGLNCFTINNQS